MSAEIHIDTEATGTGLAASAQARSTAIAGTDITLPQGQYVSSTNALAAGLVAARIANLAGRTTAGAATAQSSVSTY